MRSDESLYLSVEPVFVKSTAIFFKRKELLPDPLVFLYSVCIDRSDFGSQGSPGGRGGGGGGGYS